MKAAHAWPRVSKTTQNQDVLPSYKQSIRAGALHKLHGRTLSQGCCPTLFENYFLCPATHQNLHLTTGSQFYNRLALCGAWTLWEEGGKSDSHRTALERGGQSPSSTQCTTLAALNVQVTLWWMR